MPVLFLSLGAFVFAELDGFGSMRASKMLAPP
jgi:hypothetical protein